MTAPAREIVEPELSGLSQRIVEIVLGSWNDWRESPYAGAWRCRRSRAGFVWEQIIERAHTEFSFETGVRIIDGHETFSFLVNDRILFRFKKADETGMTSNYPTQLALAFHEHEQDLFGLPEVVRVEVAYTLNALETEIADVVVVGRDAKTVVWTYSLMDAADGVVPLPMPTPTGDPDEKSARRLVKARAPESEERKQRG
ncbi:MAG: hypothetical protein AAGI03_05580 [Pseudomonadota bacterium]